MVIVEILSFADPITDGLILRQLWFGGHLWWITFSIIFLISPYLVSYTAIGSMLKSQSNFLSFIVMTSLCWIFFLLDAVFLLYSTTSPIIFMIYKI